MDDGFRARCLQHNDMIKIKIFKINLNRFSLIDDFITATLAGIHYKN